MNYKKHYDALIAKRRNKKLVKSKLSLGEIETHHILPKSLGGSNSDDNLINLTAREHYFAHWLLYKMMPECKSMATAFKLMADIRGNKRNITSKVYSSLKHVVSLILSNRMSEYYRNLSDDDRNKMIKQHSIIMQRYWQQMDPDYKEYWCSQHSEDMLNMSPEQLASRNEKYLKTINNKSPEEKNRIQKLKSEGSKKRWNSMTDKERKYISSLQTGDNNVMRKMSEKQKLVFSLKVREGQSKWKSNMNEQQYQDLCRNQGIILQQAYAEWRKTLSDEDKAAIRDKKIKTYNSAPDSVKADRKIKSSERCKRRWKNMTEDEKTDIKQKISNAKRMKFTPEQDEFIKTHSISKCMSEFGISAKPILRRRKELNLHR